MLIETTQSCKQRHEKKHASKQSGISAIQKEMEEGEINLCKWREENLDIIGKGKQKQKKQKRNGLGRSDSRSGRKS